MGDPSVVPRLFFHFRLLEGRVEGRAELEDFAFSVRRGSEQGAERLRSARSNDIQSTLPANVTTSALTGSTQALSGLITNIFEVLGMVDDTVQWVIVG